MAPRLTALAVLLVLLLGTATFTYAAQQRIATTKPAAATKPAAPPLVVVPNVSGQAYVFAKGTLQDAGFAWRVEGSVRGYAANAVVEQRPAAGARVLDTGAPLVVLRLTANKRYAQDGEPENSSPYPGTEIRYPNAPAKSAPKPKPAPKPEPKPAPKPAPKPKPAARPPAFHVPGARKEPLDEIPLPKRAARLEGWLARHPHPTNANVRYWLYQNAWIVTGARFGWWHGAQALRLLIAADRKAQRAWGIGSRSETVARRALVEVKRRSR
ncbi:MAG: PASTA domain-containing protein [Actinobacteria bacterium]|nr:MAG: PASTA domain-containing protein [Actinomycetota bacterium]